MMTEDQFRLLADQLATARPDITPERASQIIAGMGDTPVLIGTDIVVDLGQDETFTFSASILGRD